MKTTPLRAFGAATALALSALACPPAHAEILPDASINEMCMQADLIVAGTYEDQDRLRIDEVFQSKEETIKAGGVMEVSGLGSHGREPMNLGGQGNGDGNGHGAGEIVTKRMLLFAKQERGLGDGMSYYVPMHLHHGGSKGVIWFEDKQCHAYQQVINPGGYVLVSSAAGNEAFPHGKAALWRELEQGLKERELWEDIKAIEHPEQRAWAMARFFTKATRPEGKFEGLEIEIERELWEIGANPAVMGLASILKHLEPDESIAPIANQLLAFGKGFEGSLRDHAVLPIADWIERTEHPDPLPAIWILRVANSPDPRAIEVLRPYLKHDSVKVRGAAARTLGRLGDVESFEEISEMLENCVGQGEYQRDLGAALLDLQRHKDRFEAQG